MSKGGRKIKRSTSLYGNRRRSHYKSIFAIVFTIIIAGSLIFLGYSAGKPIMDFFKHRGDNATTTPWKPAETSAVSGTTPDVTTTVATTAPPVTVDGYKALTISVGDLANEVTLTAALTQAKMDGYNAVVLPLKAKGGLIYYKSAAELAVKEGTIKSEITAPRLAELVKAAGLAAIAEVNLLEDNVNCKITKAAGYSFESGGAWYDNSIENGGRPWLSPFSATTKTFFTQLAGEVSTAGFDLIICSGVTFPPLRAGDLNYIGTIVKDPVRYKILVEAVAVFENAAKAANVKLAVELSAKQVLEDTCEAYRPAEMKPDFYMLTYNAAEIGNKMMLGDTEIFNKDTPIAERIKTVFTRAEEKVGAPILACVERTDLAPADLAAAIPAMWEVNDGSGIVK